MGPEGIGDERLRVRFNEPGVHPFLELEVRGGGEWETAALLGARQVRYYHKGASFPRIVVSGNELESGRGVRFERLPGPGGVRLTEFRGGLSVETVLELEDELPMLRVAHRVTAAEDVSVNRIFDRYDFVAAPGEAGGTTLDYWRVPHLRPRSDMVIGDHVFRSPALMMRKGGLFFALVPDLDILSRSCPPPGRAATEACPRYYMDFLLAGGENQSPAAVFGLGRCRVHGHVYFENDFQREIRLAEGQSFELGYHLLLARDGYGPSDVASFLWERYGRPMLHSGRPQAADWDRYSSAGLSRMFKRPDLFREFTLDGQRCGGTVAIHFASRRGVRLMSLGELRRYLRFEDVVLAAARGVIETASERRLSRVLAGALERYAPKVPPQVMFQSWFNNLRSAYGAYWFGRKWRDHELTDRALAVKNLAILAPREGGAFPAVCYATDQGVYWSRGTRGFKHVDRYYHTADCSTTGYYMTMWFTDHEGDPRLMAGCHALAEFLLSTQLESGAFPAWVASGESRGAAPELRESATSACPAMFLARLYTVESDGRYLRAALRACDYLAGEVIPGQKWFDYETFWSCSRKKPGFFDSHTGSWPQNTMSMYWAAEALRLAYLCTGDAGYLDLGLQVMCHLSFYQQVWDPPFLSINGFGGFGSMNTDGEWNDARQALMAPLFMDYYAVTGDREQMERGIAALRAAFALMYIEENRAEAPGNTCERGDEHGSVPENYGHFGYDHPVPGFLDSDWGAGSACQAAAYVQKHYGDIFVDLDRDIAFGINGCRVVGMERRGASLRLEVERHVDPTAETMIRVAGDIGPAEVVVNGRRARATVNGEYLVLL